MGNYRVVRKLASGGMADVFLGKLLGAEGFEKAVAIKRLKPEVATNPQGARDFLHEAQLCAHLVHPSIVQVLDFGTSGACPYLVMEFVDGPDLRKLMKVARRAGAPLTLDEALHIVAAVADALDYAYQAPGPDGAPLRVVHRDVNPVNVLVSRQGLVKLADFGVAKFQGREQTRAHLVKGKLGYMAPELIGGEPAGHPSDVFLAGVLLYEAIAGVPLFSERDDPVRSLAQILAFDAEALSLPCECPEVLPVLRKALAADPARRFQSAGELARCLRALAANRNTSVGPTHLARRMAELFPAAGPEGGAPAGGFVLRDDRRPAAPAPAAAPAPPPTLRRRPAARRPLGEILVEAGVITRGQLQGVLDRQRAEGGRLGEWVVALELAPPTAVLGALAEQHGVPFVTDEKIGSYRPPRYALDRFPEPSARRLDAVPIHEKAGTLYVAMTDPSDLAKQDTIAFALNRRFQPVLCTELGLRRALDHVYGAEEPTPSWRQADPVEPHALFAERSADLEERPRPRSLTTPGAILREASVITPVAYIPAGIDAEGRQLYTMVPVEAAPSADARSPQVGNKLGHAARYPTKI